MCSILARSGAVAFRAAHTSFLVPLLVLGCDGEPADAGHADGIDDPITVAGKADGLDGASPAEVEAVLELASTASFARLDEDVGLDVRAASHIIEHRDGVDGVEGTSDDETFEDLDQLDAVPWVGPRAFGKLLEWVRAQPADGAAPCVLISEYIEGDLDKNKGIELYNCGHASVDLSEIALCLVRNDDDDCRVASNLAEVQLPPGHVYTVCRDKHGTFNNPWPPLADACTEELGSTMIFSGDDRMVVLHDPDRVGSIGGATVVDALGRIDFRPSWAPWNEVGLRRCRSTPNLGTAFFDESDWFDVVPWRDASDWGVPPTFSCD